MTNPGVQSLSHVRLFCNSMDCSPPGSSVHGIFQARILEWVAFPFPGDLPDPGIEPASPVSPALAGRFFTTEPPDKIPRRRACQPTPVFVPGESHGQRSLAGCSPRGRKELDTTEVT